jgi:hypothetical protein
MALSRPAGMGKIEQLSLDSAAKHVLQECRMVIPGIQALFGFQLIAVFNQGFDEKLSNVGQGVHLVAMTLTALSMAVVMSPAALHRLAEPKEVSERFLWLASNLILAGMVPLAVAIGLDSYVVASIVLGHELPAVVVGIVLMVIFAWLWLLLPVRELRRH